MRSENAFQISVGVSMMLSCRPVATGVAGDRSGAVFRPADVPEVSDVVSMGYTQACPMRRGLEALRCRGIGARNQVSAFRYLRIAGPLACF